MKQAKTNPFDRLDPNDGFRVESVPLGTIKAVYVVAKSDGLYNTTLGDNGTCLVGEWEGNKPGDNGAFTRTHHLADGICRYFNAGGSWPDFAEIVAVLRDFIPGGLVFPGYVLYSTSIDFQNDVYHVFANADNPTVGRLWKEDVAVDREDRLISVIMDATREEIVEEYGERAADRRPRKALPPG